MTITGAVKCGQKHAAWTEYGHLKKFSVFSTEQAKDKSALTCVEFTIC